jgi:hypothetical protein
MMFMSVGLPGFRSPVHSLTLVHVRFPDGAHWLVFIDIGQVFPARISVFIMRIPGYAAAIDIAVLASQPTPISCA